MPIQDLFELVDPLQMKCVRESVERVREHAGIVLPEDYVQIGLCYGDGEFHGGGMRIHYFDPTADGYKEFVMAELDGWIDQCSALDVTDLTFYPADGGILPMGRFDNGTRLAFVCSGTPSEWTIMVIETLEEDRMQLDFNACDYLIRVLRGEFRPDYMPDDGEENVTFMKYPDDWMR